MKLHIMVSQPRQRKKRQIFSTPTFPQYFVHLLPTVTHTRLEGEEDITEITLNVEVIWGHILRKHVAPTVFHLVSYKNALVKLHQTCPGIQGQ